ncbi:hypothetical protein BP6252_06766 [Coleophoma cylindrospora]|uniref:N-acetyltransferase domain-containing protein n=1 Tax=Coleophoma cylindrospora TaxID=1849047 RepID=A0A3D8RFM8_9HELO|nr:hypothetical protein BP6252_06766 [Coleophoma cylindrospora]
MSTQPGATSGEGTSLRTQHRTWSQGDYVITTDPTHIPIATLNAAFASDDFYWAKGLPDAVLAETLRNSLNFSIFHHPGGNGRATADGEFMGFARCITDFTTFLYLTDVYVWPAHQSKGLGKWLVGCVQEVVESMPYLRRSLCFTSDWERSVPFYEKIMGMELVESHRQPDGSGVGPAVLMRRGDGDPSKVHKKV